MQFHLGIARIHEAAVTKGTGQTFHGAPTSYDRVRRRERLLMSFWKAPMTRADNPSRNRRLAASFRLLPRVIIKVRVTFDVMSIRIFFFSLLPCLFISVAIDYRYRVMEGQDNFNVRKKRHAMIQGSCTRIKTSTQLRPRLSHH